MPRRPRLLMQGAAYHVMGRGNRKAIIFEDDEDRDRLLTIVSQACLRFQVSCYAYCLMGNHYHLVLDTPRGNLSAAMRQINGDFASSSNRRYQRTGHVFEERFRSIIVETERYLRELARYVVLNPVRAGLVADVALWPWSSYLPTAGLAPAPSFLDLDWLDWAFGGACRAEACQKYQLFVREAAMDAADIPTNTLVMGTPSFEQALRAVVNPDGLPGHMPRGCRALGRPALRDVFGAGQSRQERNRRIWEAHTQYGYTLAEIARFLDLHPRTPSVIIRRFKV